MRASAVVKHQTMVASAALGAATLAATSCSTVARLVRRRSKYWCCSTLSWSLALFNQLSNLDVRWTSILGADGVVRSSASESGALCTHPDHWSPTPQLAGCVHRKS